MANQKTYLNTAACGLLSAQSLKTTYDFYDAMQTDSSTYAEAWKTTGWQRTREKTAKFINASAENIVFIPNFSFAINSIVQSLRGDEKVLLYKHDYPSLLDPFRINQFDITWVDATDGFYISPDEIKEKLLEHKIDIIAISHVQWLSGFRVDINDLVAFCKAHNILCIIDVTQSVGAAEVDMMKADADILIASNYKWMNAGFGNGFMYMKDSFLEKYPPVIGGNNSYTMKDGVPVYEPSIRSYEPGHLNIHGLLILEQAMAAKQSIGMDNILNHNRTLTQRLLDGLQNLPVEILGAPDTANRSSIVLVKNENGLGEHIAKNDIIVSQRGAFLRISAHFYNTEAEIDRLIEVTRSCF